MSREARPGERAGLAVALIAAIAWLPLLLQPDLLTGHADPRQAHGGHASEPRSWIPTPGAAASLAAGWAIMVVAMMTPLLVPPIRHVLERSFRRRRARSVLLFAAGHGAVWMAAGVVLLAAMQALRHLAPRPLAAAALVAGVALVWQASPARRRCLNRTHRHPALAAFGFAADRDALRFGVTHGVWCVGSCWALMLVPLALPQGHLVAMALVTFVILGESFEKPRKPTWGLRVPTRLTRILVAQARMRLAARPTTSPPRATAVPADE